MADEGWQTRTWEELKSETQARVERGAYPVFGIASRRQPQGVGDDR